MNMKPTVAGAAHGMKEESLARWAAGAAAPAPAVRRRENLRSASFRDYALEEPAGARSFNTG